MQNKNKSFINNLQIFYKTIDKYRQKAYNLYRGGVGLNMKPPVIYVISSMKGGVGKTITALQIADYFSKSGKRTLLIDLDEQRNLTLAAKVKILPDEKSSYDVLLSPETINDAIREVGENLFLVPASGRLASIDTELQDLGKEQHLKEAIELLKTEFDYIVIDCAPAFKLATLNAFVIPNARVITPAFCDDFGVNSIQELLKFVSQVRKYANNTLVIEGILLTMYSNRNILTRQYTGYIEEYAKKIGTKVFKTRIRSAIAIREALANKQSIFDYAPESKVAEDYRNFIKELEG